MSRPQCDKCGEHPAACECDDGLRISAEAESAIQQGRLVVIAGGEPKPASDELVARIMAHGVAWTTEEMLAQLNARLSAEQSRADAAEKERENYKMRCDIYNDRIDLECEKRRIESERVKELELALLWFGVHRMGCYYQLLGNEAGQDMSKCSCGIGAALAGKEATDETHR